MESLFSAILLGKNVFPPVPAGYGRVHRIDDLDDIPDQKHRFVEIRIAVKVGANSIGSIGSVLTFNCPKHLLLADCEELVERGILVKRYEHDSPRFYLAET